MDQAAPLAYRLRPQSLDAFVGQQEIVGQGTVLRQSIKNDTLTSAIFGGPPGTGKTTLAHIIAQTTDRPFVQLSAVTSGIKDIKEICAPKEHTGMFKAIREKKVLFIDEIHRFNKAQQDALLPYVEDGSIILIGATTENPFFSVNSALVSRSQVYLFKPLNVADLEAIIERALAHSDGFNDKVKVSKEAVTHIAEHANGDARIALNLLELAVMTIGKNISLEKARKMLELKTKRYDRKGEDHYDTISAFIKSMRGSDVDASLLWLYKMLLSGEEPRFLFRRMAIFASEDVGNADPRALPLVISAWQAFEFIGMPEGEFFLAHACVYLAQAPKSNAVTIAMGRSKNAVERAPTLEVPYHLRNAPVKGMAEHGYHQGYQYPHNSSKGVVSEHYFPIGMSPASFYEPTDRGFEAEVSERMKNVKSILLRRAGTCNKCKNMVN